MKISENVVVVWDQDKGDPLRMKCVIGVRQRDMGLKIVGNAYIRGSDKAALMMAREKALIDVLLNGKIFLE